MFLTAKDGKNIMGMGESLVYDFLKNAPLRVEKIGGKLIIPASSFWAWYFRDFEEAKQEKN